MIVRDLGLVHAGLSRDHRAFALVTTAFTVMGKQILHVRDGLSRPVDTGGRHAAT